MSRRSGRRGKREKRKRSELSERKKERSGVCESEREGEWKIQNNGRRFTECQFDCRDNNTTTKKRRSGHDI